MEFSRFVSRAGTVHNNSCHYFWWESICNFIRPASQQLHDLRMATIFVMWFTPVINKYFAVVMEMCFRKCELEEEEEAIGMKALRKYFLCWLNFKKSIPSTYWRNVILLSLWKIKVGRQLGNLLTCALCAWWRFQLFSQALLLHSQMMQILVVDRAGRNEHVDSSYSEGMVLHKRI